MSRLKALMPVHTKLEIRPASAIKELVTTGTLRTVNIWSPDVLGDNWDQFEVLKDETADFENRRTSSKMLDVQNEHMVPPLFAQ